MIINGWLDWATHVPGPANKQYQQANSVSGYVAHSAVGFYGGWASRLFSDERDPDNPASYSGYAAASVHGWINYDGSVIQHYPFTSSCWASGNIHANTNFIAFENEGGPPGDESERLTAKQIAANVRIIRELSGWKGWQPSRPRSPSDKTATLYEHNECVRIWGGNATACPSKRIPWDDFLAHLRGDPVLLMAGGETMSAAFMKSRNDAFVYLVTGNTKRKMHGERTELAAALGISPDVVTVKKSTLERIPEIEPELVS
ncbi:MAG: N-acetylmuramoyl-L-alanine amidase [Chloroflexi bacterium]|nr:N-acetylmuramoyl-L-alanine amidase [Chloroflexota bacterium]